MAVHHRRRGLQAGFVRLAHDVEPARGAALLGRNRVAHALHENLRAAAGHRAHPGRVQLLDDVPRAEPGLVRQIGDLRRRERMDVYRRTGLADRRHIRQPVSERDVRVVATLQQHGGGAGIGGLLHARGELLRRECVGVLRAVAAPERAEFAVRDAHVGVVRVRVVDEADGRVRVAAHPCLVRMGHQFTDRKVAGQQRQSVLRVESRAAVESGNQICMHDLCSGVGPLTRDGRWCPRHCAGREGGDGAWPARNPASRGARVHRGSAAGRADRWHRARCGCRAGTRARPPA